MGQSKLTPTQQHQSFSINIKDSDKSNALLSIEASKCVNPFKSLRSQQDNGLWISSRYEALSELEFRCEKSLSTLFIQRP
ncbi:MAG: hypothetical protein NWQ54_16410 [Paraglaciecola sp.]|nr:hypothetical protein [Paraglaciecola sp.]